MNWLKKNWRSIAGAVCGAGSVVVAVAVNPLAGGLLATACTAAFGHVATRSRELAQGAVDGLTAEERAKLMGKGKGK